MSKKHTINSFHFSIIIFLNSFRRQLQPDDSNDINPSAGMVGIGVILIAVVINILFK
jgi:hypothetical protein